MTNKEKLMRIVVECPRPGGPSAHCLFDYDRRNLDLGQIRERVDRISDEMVKELLQAHDNCMVGKPMFDFNV